MLYHDVNNYVKRCDIYLASKVVWHKPYGDLQSLPVPTHYWKDLSIDFVMSLPISTDWKKDSYDSIFIIVDWLTKMVYYKLVKITIDAPSLAKVIIDMIIKYHGFLDSIITNQGLLFISKFWSLLCYFFSIKQRLSITFYPQTDSQTKKQNSTIEAYLWAFVNFEQNNWARFFSMVEFAYNNAKNASIGHMPFELNCRYHPQVFYKEDLDSRSKLKTAKKLSFELWNLIAICQQNLYHAQKFQKQAHNKRVKPWSYAPGNKVWLNSKHLKIKRNCKLEAKFLVFFDYYTQ